MASEIKLPELGENIESAKVLKVMVSKGDTVEKDQPIVEIETDKATSEVPATAGGTVEEVKVSEGDELGIGDTILMLGGEEEAAEAEEKTEPAKEPKQEKPEEREEKAERKEKREEQKQKETEAKGPEEKRKTPAEKEKAKPEEAEAQPMPGAGAREAAEASGVAPPEPAEGRPAVAPSVRRLAREIGVDLDDVTGSGPAGRITLHDVKAHAKAVGKPLPEAERGAEAPEPELPDFSTFGDVERQPLTQIQQRTAEHVTTCWRTIPHVTLFDEADVTDVERVRSEYERDGEEHRVSVTSVLVKACAAALRAHPEVNASIDMSSGERILKRYCHIGVAVDTEQGLLVPVIRDADRRSIAEIDHDLRTLAGRARGGELSADDMRGGTFSVSNLGGIGIGRFTPIVNHPEVAILGAGRAVWRHMSHGADGDAGHDGRAVHRLMLPLSLSFDHRALDGAGGARFLRWIVEALQQPLMLSIEA